MRNIIIISIAIISLSCGKKEIVEPTIINNQQQASTPSNEIVSVSNNNDPKGLYEYNSDSIVFGYTFKEKISGYDTSKYVSYKINNLTPCYAESHFGITDSKGEPLLYHLFLEDTSYINHYNKNSKIDIYSKYYQAFVGENYFKESSMNIQQDYNNVSGASFQILDLALVKEDTKYGFRLYYATVSIEWNVIGNNGSIVKRYEGTLKTVVELDY